MTEWWHGLRLDQQVFYAIAMLSSLVLVIQLGLGVVGVDHGAGDADISVGHDGGAGIFSIQALATFFVGFGWIGVIWLNRGHGLGWSVLAGTVTGGGLMAGVVTLMRRMMRLQESGTLEYGNAVGAIGTVYVPILGRRGNGGQVEVVIQGRTVFAEAITESADVLRTGSKVRVTSLVGQSTFIVEPL